MESWPVQATLQVDHDGQGELCEAYFMESREFSLEDMRTSYQAGYQTQNGTIMVNVGAYTLEYTF